MPNRNPHSPSSSIALPCSRRSAPAKVRRAQVERVDPAIAEVADQQVVAEAPEARRRQRDAPRRVQRPTAGEVANQAAVRIEHDDHSQSVPSRARRRRPRVLVLLGVGHEQIAVDVLNAERREMARNIRLELALQLALRDRVLVQGIEHVDLAVVEVGGVQQVLLAVGGERQPLVDGAFARRHLLRLGQVDSRGPGGDHARLGGEDEQRDVLVVILKSCVPLYTMPVGLPIRDGDDQWRIGRPLAVAVVQRRRAGPVVGDPHETVGVERNPPGIHQIGVRCWGHPSTTPVRYQAR